jgi:microcystin-dependent protein
MSAIDIARGLTQLRPDWNIDGPYQFGEIGAVGAHGANTVDVYLDGSTALTTGLHSLASYTPQVNDPVMIGRMQGSSQSARVVIGRLAASTGSGGVVPIGAILMFPVSYTSSNWLLCNGGSFSSTTYPALYAALGRTTLPNLQGLAPMGAGANGVTLGASSANGQMPSHTHTDSGHSHQSTFYTGTGTTYVGVPGSGSAVVGNSNSTLSAAANIQAAGSGTPNMPPYLGVAYYIRAA